ncbi:MAG: hypothetical protein KGV44_11220 [Flavobacteriaceae bacterium]|nr:hypothetical protein [Flavobacteriaceae bacterium]
MRTFSFKAEDIEANRIFAILEACEINGLEIENNNEIEELTGYELEMVKIGLKEAMDGKFVSNEQVQNEVNQLLCTE